MLEDYLAKSKTFDKLDKERVELFEALVATKAWVAYSSLLNSIIEQKGSEVLSPAGSLDGAIALEHVKGAMCGLVLARDLPHVTIAHMKALKSPPANSEENPDD